MTSQHTVYARLKNRADRQPDRPAILTVGGESLSFGELVGFIDETRTRLHRLGIGRTSRLGILLPNRAQAGIAYLVGASTCISVPMNPEATATELASWIDEMKIDAVLMSPSDSESRLRAVRATGRTVLYAHEHAYRSVLFELDADGSGQDVDTSRPGPEDTVLLLQTSGTTGKAKIVPQSQKNRVINADRSAATMALTESDRCLNMMPMHHTQGLLGEFLSPLLAGASVVFADADPARIVSIVERFQPTWFNLVPSLHEAVLDRNRGRKAIFNGTRMRFVSSSSARLGPDLRARLVELYGLPVRESYGATEAGIIGLSGDPRTEYRPGSIGRPVHADVIVADAEGNALPAGERGEICVSGPTVISRYEDNPAADAQAFRDGWYRMGDEGYFDADGFLYVTGRLHDTVNRGGVKFMLQEIDDVIATLPGVLAGAAFLAPKAGLGHEVYAAVVLVPGNDATAESLRAALARVLSWAKVPKRVFLVPDLPRNSTGKVLRQELASRLQEA